MMKVDIRVEISYPETQNHQILSLGKDYSTHRLFWEGTLRNLSMNEPGDMETMRKDILFTK